MRQRATHKPGEPLCFVLMPFAKKHTSRGGPAIDFNEIYHRAIEPGVRAAGMLPIRADEEKLGGIIHKEMFNRLLRCEFAVADLTTSNPNVMYELGVRHAARPRTTLTIYAESTPLPFDVNLLRTEPYQLAADNTLSELGARTLRDNITRHLTELRDLGAHKDFADSPLFQLIQQWSPTPLEADPAEFSTQSITEVEAVKEDLRTIRTNCSDRDRRPAMLEQVDTIRDAALGKSDVDMALISEVMRTYRALGSWSAMIALYDKMPEALRHQPEERKLLAFAYNRRAESYRRKQLSHKGKSKGSASAVPSPAGDFAEGLAILEQLEDEQGATVETAGLIGRLYKGRWREALAEHRPIEARKFLHKAIGAYVRGFEADWRDKYTGINAVTLLDASGSAAHQAEKDKILPVVRYAAERAVQGHEPSYWDYATILVLAVHAGDAAAANDVIDELLSSGEEPWWFQSIADDLRIIVAHRDQRNEDAGWIDELIATLEDAGQ